MLYSTAMTATKQEIITRSAKNFDYSLFQSFIDYTDRKPTTTKGYLTYINQFVKWLELNNITQPEREDVKAYRDYLSCSGLATGTQAQYLRAVKHFFKWTASEDLYKNIADNIHGAKVRNDVHKRDALDYPDIEIIEPTIDRSTPEGKRLYAMFKLTTVNGFRVIELSRANIGDIVRNGDDYFIYIWGKGHDEADQKEYLMPPVKAAIDDYLATRTDDYTKKSPLFISTSNKGKPGSVKEYEYEKDEYGNFLLDEKGKRIPKEYYDGRIAETTISTMLKQMLINAGYDSERITPHSLRHTSGTAAHRAGIDLYGVQHLMRHVDPSTSEIYIHDDNNTEAEKRGRQAIYDYLFNNGQTANANGILPELEAEILQLSDEQQKNLLAQLKAQKGEATI